MAEPEKKAVYEFTCPECKVKVIYDPADPQYSVFGASRRKKLVEPTYVYLLCVNDHRRRYDLKPATP